jgi:hypothetical protein
MRDAILHEMGYTSFDWPRMCPAEEWQVIRSYILMKESEAKAAKKAQRQAKLKGRRR